MTVLTFGPYEPDKQNYQGGVTKFAQNVVPKSDGYAPWKAFAAYAAPLSAGNDSFTKILLNFGGVDASTTFTDEAAGASGTHTWTAAGNAQIDTAVYKHGGSSALFDGTGDWITTPDSADYTIAANDFTAECFFQINPAVASNGTQYELAGQCDSSATTSTTSIRFLRLNTNVICAFVAVGTSLNVVAGTTIVNNANPGMHHVRLVKSGTATRIFLNGVNDTSGTTVTVAGSINDSASVWAVGTCGAVTTLNPWPGWVDGFRLDIGIARNTGTTSFVPPQKMYDTAANGVVRGQFYARKTDGSIVAFQATSTRVFQLNNATLDWIDISKSGLAYAAVPNTDHWQFGQFGNIVIPVQANTVPQSIDISVGTVLADLAGSPPQARYIAIVNRFVVLSGLLSTPYRIQWSGLNAITTWTSGVSSSDFQDFPDGGVVRGVAGGEYGVVFQDGVIRSMIYAVGSAYIFQFIRIAEDKGLLAPYSIIRSGSSIFFLASQGFHKIVGSTVAPIPIGKEKVDATFFGDYDQSALQMILGTSDPQFSRVYWAYKSQAGGANTFDKIMVFDYVLEQWSGILQNGEFLSTLAAPGATLESLDAISTSIDALTFSLDDVALSALPKVVIADTSHRMGFFSGANVEATIDTSEQAITGRRARVQGLYPITDAAGVFGSVGYRETLQATVTYSTEQVVTARGMCHANISTRLARGRMRIPAATVWTYASGFEPLFAGEGQL